MPHPWTPDRRKHVQNRSHSEGDETQCTGPVHPSSFIPTLLNRKGHSLRNLFILKSHIQNGFMLYVKFILRYDFTSDLFQSYLKLHILKKIPRVFHRIFFLNISSFSHLCLGWNEEIKKAKHQRKSQNNQYLGPGLYQLVVQLEGLGNVLGWFFSGRKRSYFTLCT